MNPDPQPQSPEQIAPTPRTNVRTYSYVLFAGVIFQDHSGDASVDSDFARQLERELAAANAAASAMREERDRALELVSYIEASIPTDPKHDDCVIILKSGFDAVIANLRTDRNAWQRRAQQAESAQDSREHCIEEQRKALEAYEEQVQGLEADLTAAAKKHEAEVAELRREKERLDFADSNTLELRCNEVSYGDDADNYYAVIEFHMAEPREREIGRGSTIREALDDARNTASQPQQP